MIRDKLTRILDSLRDRIDSTEQMHKNCRFIITVDGIAYYSDGYQMLISPDGSYSGIRFWGLEVAKNGDVVLYQQGDQEIARLDYHRIFVGTGFIICDRTPYLPLATVQPAPQTPNGPETN